MIPNGKQFKVWCVITVISLLIVGCAPTQDSAKENVTIAEQESKTNSSFGNAVNSPNQDEVKEPIPAVDQPVRTNEEDDVPKVVQEEDVVVADEKKSTNVSENDNKFYDVSDAYDAEFPTLMGFTINDNMNLVLKRFGEPLNESVMDNGTELLQIYEYPGFTFGSDSSNRIVFIEVNSTEVNPGLNDLQVGQNVEHARVSLGAPSSLNEYVMIYASNQVIMKLDIDPNSSIIRSIKLFAE